ncbi:hypothetical protein Taro_055297 [Colocasia esculenta]|uniref:Uncharacterized protein n=1 Tax=Colocasia esculenta TaxID=4460 RepID=A0A843XTU2_COLES|nr:hypothetical protein [Colocasia esculenta]
MTTPLYCIFSFFILTDYDMYYISSLTREAGGLIPICYKPKQGVLSIIICYKSSTEFNSLSLLHEIVASQIQRNVERTCTCIVLSSWDFAALVSDIIGVLHHFSSHSMHVVLSTLLLDAIYCLGNLVDFCCPGVFFCLRSNALSLLSFDG